MSNQMDRHPTVSALAAAFRQVMREWHPGEEGLDTLRKIDTANAARANDTARGDWCASADYCDAQMAMLEAWESLGPESASGNPFYFAPGHGYGFDGGEDQVAIWNAAWSKAQTDGFAMSNHDPQPSVQNTPHIGLDDPPCDCCGEPVPVEEHCGNDRPDGTAEYLCPDCYGSRDMSR